MISKVKSVLAGSAVWALPMMALAQSGVNDSYIESVLELVLRVINNYLIPIVIGLAVLTFIWGLLKYVISKDDDAKKEARNVMVYGIIALFVMVSVWGLVNLLQNVTRVGQGSVTTPVVPDPSELR